MKKLIGILLILSISICVCFATGVTETNTEKTIVTFWQPYGEGSWSGDYMIEIVDEFNAANTDIEVKLQAYPDYASIIEALQRGVVGNQLPSIASIGYGYDRYVLNSGKAVPFNDVMATDKQEKYFSDFYDSGLDVTTFDGKVYGVPFAMSVPVVFYHSDLFEKAGLDPNNPPTTWKEFIETSKVLNEKLDIYGAAFALDDPWAFECLLRSSNGSFLDEDGNLTINSSTAKNILSDWGEGTEEGYFLYNSNFFETLMTFGANEVGMFVVSSYGTVIYRDSDPAIKVATLPKGNENDTLNAPIGGNAIYLFGNSDAEREAAVKFVEYLTSPEVNADWAMNSGYLPTRKSSINYMTEFIDGFDNYKKNIDFIDNLSAPTQWPERNVLKINQKIMDAIEGVMLNTNSADAALDNAYFEINKLL